MLELPKGVMSPVSSDPAPIQAWGTALAQSVDELLPYRWNSQVEMDTTTPTEPGQYGFRMDENMRMYRWDSVNSEWVPAALTPADQNFFRFETKAEMDLWVGQPGQRAVVWGDPTVANNQEYVWNGFWASLGLPFAMAAGRYASPGGGGSSAPVFWDTNATILLPPGRFTQPPIVTLTPDPDGTGGVGVGASVTNVTTSSFVARMTRIGASPAGFSGHWIAIQMTPASASG